MPGNTDYEIGVGHLNSGEYEKALEHLEAAARVAGEPEPHAALGMAYYRIGRFEESSRQFKKVLKKTPGDEEALYNLAAAYMKMKNFTGARKRLVLIINGTSNPAMEAAAQKLLDRLDKERREFKTGAGKSRGLEKLVLSAIMRLKLTESRALDVWLAALPFIIGIASIFAVYIIQNNNAKMVKELTKSQTASIAKDARRALDQLADKQGPVILSLDTTFSEYVGVQEDAPERYRQERLKFQETLEKLDQIVESVEDRKYIDTLLGIFESYYETGERILKLSAEGDSDEATDLVDSSGFSDMIEEMQVIILEIDRANYVDLFYLRNFVKNIEAKSGYVFSILIFICIMGIVTAVPSRTVQNYQRRAIRESMEQIEKRRRELSESYQKLQELDKMKTQFFSNVSHELRTPLTLMAGPLDSILEGELGEINPKQREYLTTMHSNTRRLLRLINNLLDISKIEAGRMKLKLSRIEMCELARYLSSSISSLADRRTINLVENMPARGVTKIYGDREKLEKVVLNLLSNALKFTPPGGKITVGVRETSDSVVFSIEDTGEGIPAAAIKTIFDRFSQVDGSTSRKYEGTGIGLSLVKEFVDLHCGEIDVESEPGRGTRFVVTLKKGRAHFDRGVLMEADADAEAESSTPQQADREMVDTQVADIARRAEEVRTAQAEAGPASDATILIVDDNPDIIKYLDMILSGVYRVVSADNGKKGVEAARREKPDMIVSDVMMPVMDGYELCKEIKSDADMKHTPVILLTAKADVGMRIEGLELGADDYISKPFNARELMARIRAILRVRELEREIRRKNEQLADLNRNLERKVERQVNEIAAVSQLKRYLPPQIAESAIRSGGVQLRTMRKQITIFFSDIRGFTSATEGMEPEETIGLLNEYLSEMTTLVFRHGGTLDKFMGDGMMAFFGDMNEMPDHASRAVGMALAMQEKMDELSDRWLREGKKPMKIGIGINTGFATVGNIGSEERMDYTAIGAHVNMSARLQALAEGGNVLVSQSTWGMIRDEYECEDMGTVKVKGVGAPVHIYKVQGGKTGAGIQS